MRHVQGFTCLRERGREGEMESQKHRQLQTWRQSLALIFAWGNCWHTSAQEPSELWPEWVRHLCVMGESVFQSSYRGWVRIFSREQQWHWWTMQKFIQTIITVLRFQLKRLNLARSQISKLAYNTKFKDWLLGICRDKCQQRKVRLRLLKFLIFIE